MKFTTTPTTLLVVALLKTASSFTAVSPSWQRTSPLVVSQPSLSSSSSLPPSPSPLMKATLQDDDDYEFARISRRRRVYEQAEGVFDDEDDEEEDWDDEDEDYDDDDEEEEYGLFSNVLIDNPLLDRIDPDGAAERFPELAADPRFWLDMVLFICFLNYLSAVGPQNTIFPELPDVANYYLSS